VLIAVSGIEPLGIIDLNDYVEKSAESNRCTCDSVGTTRTDIEKMCVSKVCILNNVMRN
jgi:hypothetical protein